MFERGIFAYLLLRMLFCVFESTNPLKTKKSQFDIFSRREFTTLVQKIPLFKCTKISGRGVGRLLRSVNHHLMRASNNGREKVCGELFLVGKLPPVAYHLASSFTGFNLT